MKDEYLICEGCYGRIHIGDEVIDMQLDEELPSILIHKNLECLLKIDGVTEGKITSIKTITGGTNANR